MSWAGCICPGAGSGHRRCCGATQELRTAVESGMLSFETRHKNVVRMLKYVFTQ